MSGMARYIIELLSDKAVLNSLAAFVPTMATTSSSSVGTWGCWASPSVSWHREKSNLLTVGLVRSMIEFPEKLFDLGRMLTNCKNFT
jgi:hypothetical protein